MKIPRIPKAFPEQDNCIFLCTDNGFAPVASVTIQSIIETADPNEKYDILLFHSGILPYHKTVIEGMAHGHDNISIRVLDISYLIQNGGFYTENRKTITQETYYRLFVPFMLDVGYKRGVYIDCDMVVLKDVNAIFRHDVSQYLIGAVRDYWGICDCYKDNNPRRTYRESIGLDNIDDYIIGGTILFNLEKYREAFSYEQVLDLVYSKQWLQHDQDVINVMCKDNILHLSAHWGMMTEWGNNNHYLPHTLFEEVQYVTDYSIYHYGGGRKPWKKYYEQENDYFWKIAPKTPYFDYLISLIPSEEYKFYILKRLCGGRFDISYGQDNIFMKTHGIQAGCLHSGYVQYRSLHIQDDVLHLEGAVASFPLSLTDELHVKILLNNSPCDVDTQFSDNFKIAKQPEPIYRLQSFKTTVKLTRGSVYKLNTIGETGGLTIHPESTNFGKYCTLGNEFRNAYYCRSGWMVTCEPDGTLLIREAGKLDVLKKELALFRELWMLKGSERKAAIVRLMALAMKPFVRKPIWLVSDRISKADDNGEVFFTFLQKHKKEIRSYFILDKKASDYSRLSKIGNVIQPYSIQHKLLTLLADCTISSQTDKVFRNPFKKDGQPYRNLLWSTKFIFLQHGVITGDLSSWLKRGNQYMAGFITSTNDEYQLICNGPYDYDNELWLTGMPRYDRLESRTEKIITIAPTWRKYLTIRQNPSTGVWDLMEGFSESTYACFYRNLVNHDKLCKAAKQHGYTIQFKLHPSFYGHEDLLGFGNNVTFISDDVSYQEIYSKSALMITDYSSSIHDFVYLYKPVIYCHFDKEEFSSGKHQWNLTADYEKTGYGEVEYTIEGTVSRIIEYMENDCALKDIYRDRIDRAFMYHDKKNCQRVFDKIMELNR